MTHYKFTLLGFGSVGQAFAHLLMRKETNLKENYGITFSVTAIATGRSGNCINPDGIDLDKALELKESGESLDALSASPAPQDKIEFIQASGADVLFENSPVSYDDGQPALDYIRTALANGMHAITANKGPVVHGYQTLKQLADDNGVKFHFESTVMDGAPVFGITRETLPTAEITGFKGILNSTTNLILSKMEDGESFEDAVAYAQSIGIAETDPSGDVDGWDAAIKVCALATVVMNVPMIPAQVDRTGIRDITPEMIAEALETGKRWKLICSAKKEGDKVITKVAPEMVAPNTPFYTVDGTTSIVQFESDVLGKLSLIEEDPGPHTTAYGLLADFVNAVKI